jgi:hypothetical protein
VSFIKNCNFYLGAPAGMYFLKKIPDGSSEIRPASFIQGSRAELDGVTAKMENDCRVRLPIVANQWKSFAEICPETDAAQDFVKLHPDKFHIPFHAILFSSRINVFRNIK